VLPRRLFGLLRLGVGGQLERPLARRVDEMAEPAETRAPRAYSTS
jgi:hypothetical protein